MLAQLYSRTVRDTPRSTKLSLRLKARESLSTEARNGLAIIFYTFAYFNLLALILTYA